MSLSRRELNVSPTRPVLVMGLEGWVDAGLSGGNAIERAARQHADRADVTFDADQLVDHRSRRPTQRIVNGVLESVTFTEIQLRYGTDAGGNDVLLLVGPEPDYQWRGFPTSCVGCASSSACASPSGSAASRRRCPTPDRSGSSPPRIDRSMANRRRLHPRRARGARRHPCVAAEGLRGPRHPRAQPLGDGAALRLGHAVSRGERRAARAAGPPRPGIVVDLTELQAPPRSPATASTGSSPRTPSTSPWSKGSSGSEGARSRPNGLSSNRAATPLDIENLPSGDEIAAELQRFLREEGQG